MSKSCLSTGQTSILQVETGSPFWIMYKSSPKKRHAFIKYVSNKTTNAVHMQIISLVLYSHSPNFYSMLHHYTTASSSSGTSSKVSLLDPLRPPWNISLSVALKLLSLFRDDPGLCSGVLLSSLNASMASVRELLPDALRRPAVDDDVSTMPLRRLSATIADNEEESGFVRGPGRICVKVFKRPGVASLGSIAR
jgi:hypothetical protein